MDVKHSQVVIIGSGPAGYTAALYAARALLQPLLVAGFQPGGQLTATTDVENYPGFVDTIQGPWLMEQMRDQAKKAGTLLVQDEIKKVNLSKRPFLCTGQKGQLYTGDTLIIATGAEAKWLGLESETKFRGMGVSACATCDGFFFKNLPVCVIGGGNTAVEEALYLSNMCSKVYLVHRRDELRAEQILQKRLFEKQNVQMVWNHTLAEVVGETKHQVSSVQLKNTLTEKVQNLKVEGVFIAIGHAPKTELFKEQLTHDAAGYLSVTPGTTQTSCAGVFAAGDVQDQVYRQAVTAAGTGCMAALDALHFLQQNPS